MKKEWIVIEVDGGVAETVETDGIDVFFFDWDNLEQAEDVEDIDNAIGEAESLPDSKRIDKVAILERLNKIRKNVEAAQ